jgi:hypothetical protein
MLRLLHTNLLRRLPSQAKSSSGIDWAVIRLFSVSGFVNDKSKFVSEIMLC